MSPDEGLFVQGRGNFRAGEHANNAAFNLRSPMSFASDDLRLAVVEIFGEAQQLSKYSYSYQERALFIVRRGTGASCYQCEFCGSRSETHRCVLSDRAPPAEFTCAVQRKPSAQQAERLRTLNRERERARRRKFSYGPAPKKLPTCPFCKARSPEHRCAAPPMDYEMSMAAE